VRLSPNDTVFDWPYPRFLLIMLTEIVLYTAFVTIGVLNRKRPRIHRPMMLMASLATLSGATARTPFLWTVFGHASWFGFFGPVISLGALLLLVRFAMTRSVDRWFAAALCRLRGCLCCSGKVSADQHLDGLGGSHPEAVNNWRGLVAHISRCWEMWDPEFQG
jgi:hypothetical protein